MRRLLASAAMMVMALMIPSHAVTQNGFEISDEVLMALQEALRAPVGIQVGDGLLVRNDFDAVSEGGNGLVRTDWNNDGHDEILLLEPYYSMAELGIPMTQVFVGVLLPDMTRRRLYSVDWAAYNPTAADTNGDGLPELCVDDWLGALVYSQTGETLLDFKPQDAGSVQVVLADLRNNGRGVVIAALTNAPYVVAINIAGETIFQETRDIWMAWGVQAADLDGDDELEVIYSTTDEATEKDELTVLSSDLKHARAITPPEFIGGFAAVDHDGDGKSELLLPSGTLIDASEDVIYRGHWDEYAGGGVQLTATIDITDNPGLETALASIPHNMLRVFGQNGVVLYLEGFEQEVMGLISTEGLEGWEAGFLVQLADGTLIHYTRAK